MYTPNPIWTRYRPTRWIHRFLTQYTDTLLFKTTVPVSSGLAILSNLLDENMFLLLAILTLFLPPLYFAWRYRPFYVSLEWENLNPGDIHIRAEQRGRVVLDDGQALVRVKVFFDESVSGYALKIDPDKPLSATPTDEPPNAEYKDGILEQKDMENPQFYFGLRIREVDPIKLYEPEVRIRDANNNDKLLLSIGVT